MGEVKFEKLTTKYGFYYRIRSDITQVKPPNKAFLQLSFNQNVKDEELPVTEVIIQSESSSH